MVEAGMIRNWANNFQAWLLLNDIKTQHGLGTVSEERFTNYFQRVVLANKERNSVDLVREGEPIGGNDVKMVFVVYAVCICLAISAYGVETFRRRVNKNIFNLNQCGICKVK